MSDREYRSDDHFDNAETRVEDLKNFRAVCRAASYFLIKSLSLVNDVHHGDAVEALIFTAIWTANISHIRGQESFNEAPIPEDLRRPVTVARLAQLVGIPPETVRRHVNRMLEAGMCRRVGRKGVIVPEAVFLRPEMVTAAKEQYLATRQLHRTLSQLLRI